MILIYDPHEFIETLLAKSDRWNKYLEFSIYSTVPQDNTSNKRPAKIVYATGSSFYIENGYNNKLLSIPIKFNYQLKLNNDTIIRGSERHLCFDCSKTAINAGIRGGDFATFVSICDTLFAKSLADRGNTIFKIEEYDIDDINSNRPDTRELEISNFNPESIHNIIKNNYIAGYNSFSFKATFNDSTLFYQMDFNIRYMSDLYVILAIGKSCDDILNSKSKNGKIITTPLLDGKPLAGSIISLFKGYNEWRMTTAKMYHYDKSNLSFKYKCTKEIDR